MSENVIRQDIIQIGIDSNLKVLQEILGDLDSIKKSVNGVGKEDGFDKAKKNAKKFDSALSKVGKTAGTVAKKVASITFKGTVAGIGACATALGGLTTQAVNAYGEFQQLEGGVKTLFGTKETKSVQEYAKLVGKSTKEVTKEYNNRLEAEKLVMKNANNGFKTAGLSANEYMETVTTFSASLIQSLGGDTMKGAKLADKAMQDMADNANKMGTDMSMIQNAYSGLARGQYMTLDNLKLGYGGTKEEMKRLLKDAGKLTGQKYDISSYADIIEAIHAIQENLGITGTTAKEAHKTIQGSFNAMKASWQNLLPALVQGGDSFDQCINNLVESAGTFGKNIMPAVESALGGVGKLIERSAPLIEEYLPKLVDRLIPPIIKAGTSLFVAIVKSLPKIVAVVIQELPNVVDLIGEGVNDAFGDNKFVKGAFDGLSGSLRWMIKNVDDVKKASVTAVKAISGIFMAVKAFKTLNKLSSVFSKFKGGKGGKGGTDGLGNSTSIFSSFANTSPKVILKGMVNLGIIVGGLMILLIALNELKGHIGNGANAKALLKTIVLIGVLGAVGTGMAKLGGIAGAIPVATVAKGLANMAIMIVGLGALVAIVSLFAPMIAKLSGNGSLVKVIVLMTVLGAVGTVLSIFASIAGVIPITTVLLGLANIALVVVGLGALVALLSLVAPKIAKLSDNGSLLKLITLMTVIGTLGTVLTIFAGIAGLIPIPVVLAGLANIALVIGGITALIVAFGALSKIKGFNEFIKTGGDTLALLFQQIGKIAGSLVGGLAEGLLSSLPSIGKSIASFGRNIKPFFTAIKGADTKGIGAFFKGLAVFMVAGAEGGLMGFIKGKTDLSKLGTQLSQFAINALPFFTTVAILPDEGFGKSKKLFDCLAGIKGLPKEGGVVGWFTGKVNFASLSEGLGKLASEKVVKFFNTVSEMKAIAFDNTKLLFDALSQVKGLPKEGGVAQWFTGKINYKSLVNGLGKLSSEKVVNFFNYVSKIPAVGFNNTRLLFNALAEVKSLPKEGGVAQWFTGKIAWGTITNNLPKIGKAVGKFYSSISGIDDFSKISKLFEALGGIGEKVGKDGGAINWISSKIGGSKKTALENLGDELKSFGKKVKNFFTDVNNLNVENLNGLWDSLKKPKSITTNVSTIVSDSIKDMVKKVSNLPIKMGEGIKKNASSFSNAIASMWRKAVTASVSPANQLIKGGNHILSQFGSDKRLTQWTAYARGTNGHKGGNALVNDGRGAELVQMPNGATFIPRGRNVMLPNAPKGMKVLDAQRTASVMGKSSPTFRYANGVGFDAFSYNTGKELVNAVEKHFVTYNSRGYNRNVSEGMVSTSKGAMNPWADNLIKEYGVKGLASYVASAGVSQWRSTVIRALKLIGQYSEANVKRTLFQMQTESGGNPRAINNWDSNAKKGIPSKGLMQVIDPTFKAYAQAPYNQNIYDPLSNILASMRYAIARYGSLAKAYQGHGYANGGIATKPSIFGEAGAEMAIPLSKNKRKRAIELWRQTGEMLGLPAYSPDGDSQVAQNKTENNTYAPVFNLTVSGTNDDRTMARKVKTWVSEALEECFESMERVNA